MIQRYNVVIHVHYWVKVQSYIANECFFFTLHRMDIYGADQAISVNIGTEEELRKQNQVMD